MYYRNVQYRYITAIPISPLLGIKIELPDQEPDDDDDVKPNPMDSLSVEMKVRGLTVPLFLVVRSLNLYIYLSIWMSICLPASVSLSLCLSPCLSLNCYEPVIIIFTLTIGRIQA